MFMVEGGGLHNSICRSREMCMLRGGGVCYRIHCIIIESFQDMKFN